MNLIKMTLMIFYTLTTFKTIAKNLVTPNLKEGLFVSSAKKCADKSVLKINKGDEQFYLIGKNSRFLINPKFKETEEDYGGCHYTYRSINKGDEFIEQEVRSPCLGSKLSITKRSKLKIRSEVSFELYRTERKACRYIWKED
jgi:hypothetical protein